MNLQPLHSAAINGDQIWYGSGDASLSLVLAGDGIKATKAAAEAVLSVEATGSGVLAIKGTGAGTIHVDPTNQPLEIETFDVILLENGIDICVMEFGSSAEQIAVTKRGDAAIYVNADGITSSGILRQGEAFIRLFGKYDIPDRLPIPDTYYPTPTSRRVHVLSDTRDLLVSQERRRT